MWPHLEKESRAAGEHSHNPGKSPLHEHPEGLGTTESPAQAGPDL